LGEGAGEDAGDDVIAACAEGHADADFFAALGDSERHEGVDAHGREQQDAERGAEEYGGLEAADPLFAAQCFIEWADVAEVERGIDGRGDVAQGTGECGRIAVAEVNGECGGLELTGFRGVIDLEWRVAHVLGDSGGEIGDDAGDLEPGVWFGGLFGDVTDAAAERIAGEDFIGEGLIDNDGVFFEAAAGEDGDLEGLEVADVDVGGANVDGFGGLIALRLDARAGFVAGVGLGKGDGGDAWVGFEAADEFGLAGSELIGSGGVGAELRGEVFVGGETCAGEAVLRVLVGAGDSGGQKGNGEANLGNDEDGPGFAEPHTGAARADDAEAVEHIAACGLEGGDESDDCGGKDAETGGVEDGFRLELEGDPEGEFAVEMNGGGGDLTEGEGGDADSGESGHGGEDERFDEELDDDA